MLMRINSVARRSGGQAPRLHVHTPRSIQSSVRGYTDTDLEMVNQSHVLSHQHQMRVMKMRTGSI